MGAINASRWVQKLADSGRKLTQRGAGSTANKAGAAGKLEKGAKKSGILARGVKGVAGLVAVDYAIDIVLNEAADYSDFVERNKEEIKVIVSLGLLAGVGRGRKLSQNAAAAFSRRWRGMGSLPALFPVSAMKFNHKAFADAAQTVSVKLRDGLASVAVRGKTVGHFSRELVGKKHVLTFGGSATLAGILGTVVFGQGGTQLSDEDMELDLATIVAMALAKGKYDAALAAVANLMKTFDPLDLLGSPRYIAELAMQREPLLDVESIFKVMDSVRYSVENDAGDGLWFLSGETEQLPVVSFCGRLISLRDDTLLPAGGVMLSAPTGKWVQEKARLDAIGYCLVDMVQFSRKNGTLPLFQADTSNESQLHKCFQHDADFLVSEPFSFAGNGLLTSVQVVRTGSSVIFITDGFADLGPMSSSLNRATLEEVLGL